MLVHSIMTKEVLTLPVDATVQHAAQEMAANSAGSVVLVDGSELAGIVTHTDLTVQVVAQGRDPTTVSLEEIRSQPVITIEPSAQVDEAIDLMVEHGIRHLVVTLEDELRGMVTVTDIANAEPELARRAREHLRTRWEG